MKPFSGLETAQDDAETMFSEKLGSLWKISMSIFFIEIFYTRRLIFFPDGLVISFPSAQWVPSYEDIFFDFLMIQSINTLVKACKMFSNSSFGERGTRPL